MLHRPLLCNSLSSCSSRHHLFELFSCYTSSWTLNRILLFMDLRLLPYDFELKESRHHTSHPRNAQNTLLYLNTFLLHRCTAVQPTITLTDRHSYWCNHVILSMTPPKSELTEALSLLYTRRLSAHTLFESPSLPHTLLVYYVRRGDSCSVYYAANYLCTSLLAAGFSPCCRL